MHVKRERKRGIGRGPSFSFSLFFRLNWKKYLKANLPTIILPCKSAAEYSKALATVFSSTFKVYLLKVSRFSSTNYTFSGVSSYYHYYSLSWLLDHVSNDVKQNHSSKILFRVINKILFLFSLCANLWTAIFISAILLSQLQLKLFF